MSIYDDSRPADVGQDGAFMLQLALGTDCHLTVVAEQGDQIGRGPSVPIRVIGPTNGVDLHGPRSEELWSPERQLEVAAQLVRMGDALVEQRQRRARPELEANLGGPEAVVVQAWAAQEDRRQEEMQQQLDALEDPETARAYLIDALLSLY